MPKNREMTRSNAKLGRRLRAEIRESGLDWRDACGVRDPTGGRALAWIAYPGIRREDAGANTQTRR